MPFRQRLDAEKVAFSVFYLFYRSPVTNARYLRPTRAHYLQRRGAFTQGNTTMHAVRLTTINKPRSRTPGAWFRALFLITLSLFALHMASAHAQTPIRFVLNWKYEGPQAWFFLAQDRGYFKAEGLDVSFDQGDGSAGSIPKVASGAYDAGFGDINALIDLAGQKPSDAPIAVFLLYNVTPFAFAVPVDSPIHTPRDLEGRTIGGGVNDATLKLFPAFARINHVDTSKVKITNIAPALSAQLLDRGQLDAASTYVTTFVFADKSMGVDPAKKIRFIRYDKYGMNLYSNTVFFSRTFVANHPDAVRGFVRALNHAIRDVIADPDAGISALMKREPLLNRDVETQKLLFTLHNDMSSPEIAHDGIGNVDDTRLAGDIRIVADALALPHAPTPQAVFDSNFLPPQNERIFKVTP
ncbi:NitT/TauT family transport system substrate-binding protein [Paraburkholderia sp. GAS333]|uniref:ABC transporter substrate-binding protein n=1 Tax=Paraburkholderia sp. GAS333 TaxID=3156279 RepID=UPI003D221E50